MFSLQNRTCFVRSGVKSGKCVKFVVPPVADMLPLPLLFVKLLWNILFLLCCNCAPGARFALLWELLEPMLEVLADSQLSPLPFCKIYIDEINNF